MIAYLAGHYTADIYNPVTKTWRSFNDKRVETLSWEQLHDFKRQRDAYMLFYSNNNTLVRK